MRSAPRSHRSDFYDLDPGRDRRAIVSGGLGAIVGYDLQGMAPPLSASRKLLAKLAAVVAGRRTKNRGNLVSINSGARTDRWEQLRRSPDAPSRTPTAAAATDRPGP